jgi:selenide,water dikinase
LPPSLPDWQRHLLTDPQTSGGLLVACTPERADAIAGCIRDAGYPAACVIGQAKRGPVGIRVVA